MKQGTAMLIVYVPLILLFLYKAPVGMILGLLVSLVLHYVLGASVDHALWGFAVGLLFGIVYVDNKDEKNW